MAEELTIKEFVGKVSLANVRLQAESSRLLSFPDPSGHDGEPLAEEGQALWKVAAGTVGNRLGYVIGMKSTTKDAVYEINYSVDYTVDSIDLSTVQQGIVDDFCSKVVFYTIYPYFRGSLAQAASRLGAVIPMLPVIKMGDMVFTDIQLLRMNPDTDDQQENS
ncbi:hypothetical protein BPY_06660 [Bifidobacterium psychraerophilum]|uniref:hypothetical protein n=1 Tax=Bifidobacterium psychraerophilum TaxID=218140 RepID=UPI00310DA073